MTSTMLQPNGLGSHPRGEHMGSNTREGLVRRRLQWEGRGFQEGTQGPGVDEAARTLMNSGHQ